MQFVVGCGKEEFTNYYVGNGYDGSLEHLINVVIKDPSQLIVWREDGKVVSHAVWHEGNTEEHRKGEARYREDTEAVEKLLGGKKRFVELHELWLTKEYRRKGHGEQFFTFFEDLMESKGFDDIVFYAHHPAALAICRKRGYKDGGYLKEVGEYVFCKTGKC